MKSRTTTLAMQIRRETCLANPLKKTPNKQKATHWQSGWNRFSLHFTSHPPHFPKTLICTNQIHSPEKSKFSCKYKQRARPNTRDRDRQSFPYLKQDTAPRQPGSATAARTGYTRQFSISMKHAHWCRAWGIRRQDLTTSLVFREERSCLVARRERQHQGYSNAFGGASNTYALISSTAPSWDSATRPACLCPSTSVRRGRKNTQMKHSQLSLLSDLKELENAAPHRFTWHRITHSILELSRNRLRGRAAVTAAHAV